MLGGSSFLVSQELPSSYEQESKWSHNNFHVIELSNGMRHLEDAERMRLKRLKLLDVLQREEKKQGRHDPSLSQVDQPDNQHRGGDLPGAGICEDVQKKLLEGPLYLVFRELQCASEQESMSIYDTFQVIGFSNGKCLQEDEDQMSLKRSSKLLYVLEQNATMQGFRDFPLFLVDQSDNRRHNGDQSDTSFLINQLGRDISINCLIHCSRSDYGSIASLNRSFQSLIRSGELYRLRRQMGIVEHWVYFSCNLLQWMAFDPIRGRWMHLPRMTLNECFMCSDKESLAVGTELLVFGKEIESHVVYKYSILTNSWSSGTKTHTPRCLFGSASLGEIAIVAGGCDSWGNILSSAELYNSETGAWITLPSMNKPRKLCSGVFMDGKFYVIGGVGVGSSKALTCGEMYDLEKRTWHEIPNMFPASGVNQQPATSKAPPLLAVVKNELYAGYSDERVVRKYDKANNTWSTVARLPEEVASMNGWGLAFRACGDQLIVIGGSIAAFGGVIELNSWVPDEGPSQWKLLATRQLGSFVYNCAVMGC